MNLTDIEQRNLSHRLYTALVLPLKDDEIDEPGLRKLVRYYAEHRFSKVGGLIANPEAGEVSYLSRSEKRRVLKIVMEEAGGRLPVLAGTFGWTTKDAVEAAKDAKEHGVDGIFVIPPLGRWMCRLHGMQHDTQKFGLIRFCYSKKLLIFQCLRTPYPTLHRNGVWDYR